MQKHKTSFGKHFVAVLFFCCVFINSSRVMGAEIVGSPILLCENGYSADGSTCTTYNDGGRCDSGYYQLISTDSFIAPQETECRYATYKKVTLPDTAMYPMYFGVLVGDPVTLCTNGYSTDGSTCTTYTQKNCDAGYHTPTGNQSSFTAPESDLCQIAGYSKKTYPDTTAYVIYNGLIVGSEITLCTNGYSADGSTCTTYSNGYCPNDYYDLNNGDATFAGFTDFVGGVCGTGYHAYTAESGCGYSLSGTTCVDLCTNGSMTTDIGTCASLCDLGVTTLRTSTGLIIPMWSTKQITPSVNIGINDGENESVCYVNLVPGATNESAIMFKFDDKLYHTSN